MHAWGGGGGGGIVKKSKTAMVFIMTCSYFPQRRKLEENLIFFLAGLEKENYLKISQIFQMYEAGKLTKLPQVLLSGRADCAPSNFKGLRGLSDDIVSDLLSKIISKELDLKNLNAECKKIKDMRNMKKEFVKQTGMMSWSEAKEKFKYYTSDDKLQAFVGKAFNSKNEPSSDFLTYCRKAVVSCQQSVVDGDPMSTIVVHKIGEVTVRCILFDLSKSTDLTYSNLCNCVPGFPGFSLIFATIGSMYTQ